MREFLRALERGLWALRQLIDLAGILLITALFVLFGLQFKHPPGWDNLATVMSFRRVADPLLSQIASGLDLAWPSEKPSVLPIALTVAAFFGRSLAAYVLERASAQLRRRIAKQPAVRKRRIDPPVSASTPDPATPAQTAPPILTTPADLTLPTAPSPPESAASPAPATSTSASSPSEPVTMAVPPPASLPVADGTFLSDFLHFEQAGVKTPNTAGRTPRLNTPTPSHSRRRDPRIQEGPVDPDAPTLLGRPSGEHADLPIFGRYEILEELGRGGMGVVFKARDPKIDRIVAIKSMLTSRNDDESSEEFERRFRREVKAVGKLTHPNIVTVFDFIEDHLGRPAMVMEYVEGETLQQLATRQRPDLAHSLEIMIQAAEALDHAHAQGIVHRDMKPANILIGRDGRAKVSDFGIAKVGGGTNTNTQGKLMGTPAFMSPEQFIGRKVDGRSDIFSLGGILYWLCTGQRPFSGDTIANLAYQVVHVTQGSVLLLNRELPSEIDEIVAASMAKSEDNRYPSARHFAADLKALRDGRPLPSLATAAESEPETLIVQSEDVVVEFIDGPEGTR